MIKVLRIHGENNFMVTRGEARATFHGRNFKKCIKIKITVKKINNFFII